MRLSSPRRILALSLSLIVSTGLLMGAGVTSASAFGGYTISGTVVPEAGATFEGAPYTVQLLGDFAGYYDQDAGSVTQSASGFSIPTNYWGTIKATISAPGFDTQKIQFQTSGSATMPTITLLPAVPVSMTTVSGTVAGPSDLTAVTVYAYLAHTNGTFSNYETHPAADGSYTLTVGAGRLYRFAFVADGFVRQLHTGLNDGFGNEYDDSPGLTVAYEPLTGINGNLTTQHTLAGVLVDGMGAPIDASMMILLRSETENGSYGASTKFVRTDNDTGSPYTSADGVFRWDVLPGWYKIFFRTEGIMTPAMNASTDAFADLVQVSETGFEVDPMPSAAPSISAAVVGRTASASSGSWASDITVDGVDLLLDGVSAGASSLLLTDEDAGRTLTGTVSAHRTVGTRTFPFTREIPAVTVAPRPALLNLVLTTPQIELTTDGTTLAATDVTVIPGSAALEYQWLRSGTAVAGATGTTYALAPADRGHVFTVRLTATLGDYATKVRTSPAVTAPKLTLVTAAPKISGTAKVGKTLTAKAGTWGPAPVKLTYRWYANGKAISAATKSSYRIPSKYRGKKITVRVTGSQLGYTTVTRASASTAKVK